MSTVQRHRFGESTVVAEQFESFSDPEMDMNRAVRAAENSGIYRFIATLRRFSPGFFTVQSPKRSVDRAVQEFSASWR